MVIAEVLVVPQSEHLLLPLADCAERESHPLLGLDLRRRIVDCPLLLNRSCRHPPKNSTFDGPPSQDRPALLMTADLGYVTALSVSRRPSQFR